MVESIFGQYRKARCAEVITGIVMDPTRHDPAEPPPPCLQSTESRIPIPIANDVLGTVIGRDFNPEFANHMTMSGSQALIQLVGPSASVLAMGSNPVAIWGEDGSTCTLLRRGERSRLLFNGDRISLVAQPTGQVDAGCTHSCSMTSSCRRPMRRSRPR